MRSTAPNEKRQEAFWPDRTTLLLAVAGSVLVGTAVPALFQLTGLYGRLLPTSGATYLLLFYGFSVIFAVILGVGGIIAGHRNETDQQAKWRTTRQQAEQQYQDAGFTPEQSRLLAEHSHPVNTPQRHCRI